MTLELIASLSALVLAVFAAFGYFDQKVKAATSEGQRREMLSALREQAEKLEVRVLKLEESHNDARIVQTEILGDLKNLIGMVTKLTADFETHMREEKK